MKNATYVGPNERFQGETALVRDDPEDHSQYLVQFDTQPFYVGGQNLASGWHPFRKDHWRVEE